VRLLRLEDLDFERALIRFRRAKGDKTLDVAVQPETRAALSAYLEWGRPTLLDPSPADPGSADDPGWLFVSACQSDGVQPLSMNAVSLMLTRRYHAGGGNLRTFGSHRIRHATATLLVNNGMPLEEVSHYLGHSLTRIHATFRHRSGAERSLPTSALVDAWFNTLLSRPHGIDPALALRTDTVAGAFLSCSCSMYPSTWARLIFDTSRGMPCATAQRSYSRIARR
jgi:hypothetical protein